MNYKYKIEIKNRLPEYLEAKGINPKKSFKCFNSRMHKNNDNKPSMGYKSGMVYCFTCNTRFDIYDLIGQDYNLNTFKSQYEQACKLFNYDDEFIKSSYKATMEKFKNNIVDLQAIEKKKEERYNKFCDKLNNKRNKFLKAMDLLDDYKHEKVYLDYKFKVDFIEKFLNQIVDYSPESLNLIKDFNRTFQYEYDNFMKVLELMEG